eukprot:gnl/TRDRNA2_/TRDRNA2_81816_c0_seq1.p1 gnl/TRDRNA2_/TRDRNA2_81816_c0~~gnl/TRDRNA2_/TRDRNA2_81816_c0_seq1.p1  ORF type:complete len:651 (+),score=87.71 gnl/TRDRNA2_/TRDRNA2_81816_c0_seq1:84-2036(+)
MMLRRDCGVLSRGGEDSFIASTPVVVPPRPPKEWPVLYKDFYLKHPHFDSEEYCWGNLEAAHPVLGARSEEEVAAYRRKHGICVETVRGRRLPKPFTSFGETSFPDFVEELAYELFTEKALPFAIQAQAWPCVLSGMDVVAVGPTGSGKTLAFLLPALVHMMAQPVLEQGEGPITLVLEPTRELAQQTNAVAQKFCSRTSGEDTLRSRAVFGGVDPKMQVPSESEPDNGRWPELLVATPGRLLDLVRRQWLNLERTSYVVLDEADLLVSPRVWMPQVRSLLAQIRPDRQLLLFSATWPAWAEESATELCGEEMVRIRVEPPVPHIPQEVQLFPGSWDAADARRTALLDWLQHQLQPKEAVLVLCANQHTVTDLVSSSEMAEAAGGEVVTLTHSASGDERVASYWKFVHGDARVLVTTFALGSRGLDYADSTAAAVDSKPLSLVVLLFDFPSTILDYAHCIGRTMRPGQVAGRAVAFLPEGRYWIARELVAILQQCGQKVPENLVDLVDADQVFLEECRDGMARMKAGEAPCAPGDNRGEYDAERCLWTLQPSVPSYRRKLLHWLADEMGLPHISTGENPARTLHIARNRNSLPDKFFLEGEEVEVMPHGARAEVVDPVIHRRRRTVKVRFRTGKEADISVDNAHPCVGGG